MGSSCASSGSFWILSLFLAVLMFSPLCLAKYERPAVSRKAGILSKISKRTFTVASTDSKSIRFQRSPHPVCRGASYYVCSFHFSRLKDRDLNRRKEACYIDIDNGLWGRGCRSSHIAKENCALRCVSGGCYNTVYGEDPLEEGEVDIKRGRDFRNCLRKEIQEEKKLAKE